MRYQGMRAQTEILHCTSSLLVHVSSFLSFRRPPAQACQLPLHCQHLLLPDMLIDRSGYPPSLGPWKLNLPQLKPGVTLLGDWGLEMGSPPHPCSPSTAWHQHLYCRFLLLLSKAVLKGDGFLIEIRSIGSEARRAQHEHTSGEIALGRGGGAGGRGQEPPAVLLALLWSL